MILYLSTKDINRETLSTITGKSIMTVSRWYNGSTPSLKDLSAIAKHIAQLEQRKYEIVLLEMIESIEL